MDYQEFITKMVYELQFHVPKGSKISLQKVIKNNNLQLDGLTIMRPGSNVSPTFYMNYYYDEYKETKDFDHILHLIVESFEKHLPPPHINPEFFTDFDLVKDHIVYKLVNFSLNKDLLKEIPHIPYLDLAIVFYCLVRHESFPNGTILIRNHHIKDWNISDEELYDIAIKNTPKLLPHQLITMKDLLMECHALPSDEFPFDVNDFGQDDEVQSNSMFILSNTDKMFGAGCILYLNLLDDISERFKSSFYLLPSSIHEVILVPSNNTNLFEHYTNMVHEVNSTHVLDEDILADHAYFYNRESKALMCR